MVNLTNHTVSLVALVTDAMRGRKPVVGVAFNSIGRFGSDNRRPGDGRPGDGPGQPGSGVRGIDRRPGVRHRGQRH